MGKCKVGKSCNKNLGSSIEWLQSSCNMMQQAGCTHLYFPIKCVVDPGRNGRCAQICFREKE